MAREKLTAAQWGEIQILWITTDKSIRSIAEDFGISDAMVRKKASKEAWGPRNAPARKRALVAGAAAGSLLGAHREPSTQADDLVIREAEEDIRDMNLAARVGRRILQRCEWLLDLVKIKDGKQTDEPDLDDPKDLKATAEAARSAVEMIRRARNLDEPAPPPKDESALDRLAATLEQARRDRS